MLEVKSLKISGYIHFRYVSLNAAACKVIPNPLAKKHEFID